MQRKVNKIVQSIVCVIQLSNTWKIEKENKKNIPSSDLK